MEQGGRIEKTREITVLALDLTLLDLKMEEAWGRGVCNKPRNADTLWRLKKEDL